MLFWDFCGWVGTRFGFLGGGFVYLGFSAMPPILLGLSRLEE